MASTAREVAFASKPQTPPPDSLAQVGSNETTGEGVNAVDADEVQYPEFVVAGTAPQEASAGNLYRQLHADDDGDGNEIQDTRDEDFAYLEAISERERAIQASQEDQVQKFLQLQRKSTASNIINNSAFVHEKALEALSKPVAAPSPSKNVAKRRNNAGLASLKIMPKVSKIVKAKKRPRFSEHPSNNSAGVSISMTKPEKPAAENENELPRTESSPAREDVAASAEQKESETKLSGATRQKETEAGGVGSLGLGYDDVVSSESETEGD